MSDSVVGYLTTVEFMEKFFERCIHKEAITQKERIEILNEMVKEREAVALTDFELRKEVKGKKVLHLKAPKRRKAA